jgi:ADA HAT complex component 1
MLRYFPWGSGLGGNKVTAEEVKILAAKQRTSPVMEVPVANKLKRKRADSGESESARNGRSPNKKRLEKAPVVVIPKMNGSLSTERDLPTNNHQKSVGKTEPGITPKKKSKSPTPKTDPTPSTMSKSDVSKLKQAIQAEISLEILLKHNELRLIDQEIGKCQIALEQLRRCQEIPFPATSSAYDDNLAVANGTGPSLSWTGVGQAPEAPPPWGVADGPYTRHYSRWLLPDSKFDGGDNEPLLPPSAVSAKTPIEGRTTRGSFGELTGVAGKSSRSQRGSTGSKLQALSAGYPQPKDKAGPLIMTRASDGLLVKLVCLNCRRDNFSSAQGFINHCRIAHNQLFASHEAAAQVCGEVVETDEAGALIGVQNEASSIPSASLVHPFIRAAHTMGSDEKSTVLSKKPPDDGNKATQLALPQEPDSASSTPTKNRKRGRKPKAANVAANFVPSPDTPFLSALMQKKGSGLDLKDIVLDAKTRVELESSSSEDESEELNSTMKEGGEKGGLRIQGSRQPAQASMSPAPLDRPSSRKGLDKANRKPKYLETFTPRTTYTSPYALNNPTHHGGDIEMLDPSPTNLSPNTIESNQAPSLVSDDDEYEAQSESESPSSAEADNDEGDLDVEVEDDEETTTTGGSESASTNDHELSSVIKSHPNPARRASALRGSISRNRREAKHVSFVSPDVSDAPSPRRGPGRRKSKG